MTAANNSVALVWNKALFSVVVLFLKNTVNAIFPARSVPQQINRNGHGFKILLLSLILPISVVYTGLV